MISRVLAASLVVAAVLGLGCDESSLKVREEHVLNRTGYGPDPWSRQRIRSIGIDAYIEEQLRPAGLDDSELESRLRSDYPALRMSLAELRRRYTDPNGSPFEVRRQLSHAKVLRAVYSKRQLEQVLVDFWFNHFNVDARRPIALWAVVPYERDAIRPHVLGRFENMLRAVARHPAMLEYLDNARNFREGFSFVRGGRVYGINENFAREVLELHTVGPGAGQTLEDIRNTALAFTGWTVDSSIEADEDGFVFVPGGHDESPKRILRLSMPGGRGIADGNDLISYLSRHPSTAAHLAQKLCRRFVAERATGCEVAAAARFLQTGGDLRAVMREVLNSQAFWDPRNFRAKAKRPMHLLASVGRAMGLDDRRRFAYYATNEMRFMGEELYGAAPPIGWPDLSRSWLGEGAFIRRLNLGDRTHAYGMRPPASAGTTDPAKIAGIVIGRLVHGGVRSSTQTELLRHLRSVPAYARLSDATTLVLSGPEFSHH